MAPDLDPKSYDQKDAALYGLGTARKVEDFYALFGMDVRKKTIVPELCKFVKSGAMHKAFSAHLRPDGKGIDYTALVATFDIRAAIEEIVAKMRAGIEDHLRAAIKKKKVTLPPAPHFFFF